MGGCTLDLQVYSLAVLLVVVERALRSTTRGRLLFAMSSSVRSWAFFSLEFCVFSRYVTRVSLAQCLPRSSLPLLRARRLGGTLDRDRFHVAAVFCMFSIESSFFCSQATTVDRSSTWQKCPQVSFIDSLPLLQREIHSDLAST